MNKTYRVVFSSKASKQMLSLEKRERKADFEKLEKLLKGIETHPRIGTGHPEQLKYRQGEVWSRKVNKKDRIVYRIYEETIFIEIESTLGHYQDK